MFAVSGGMTPSTAYMDGTNTSADTRFLANSSITIGTKGTRVKVIQCHIAWVVALSIVSMVTIIASLVHPITYYFCIQGPDIMLNISSLATRNNPYIALPANGSLFSASPRARLMKSYKVRFGDVETGADVARLALASLDPIGLQEVSKVQKGQFYE